MSKYNGWTNYETWCVHLWLSNDEDLSVECQGLQADKIQELVENNNPLNDHTSMYSDMLQTELDLVNWQEIAEAFEQEEKQEEMSE